MKFIKFVGQPFCVLLYVLAIYCAFVKTAIPLIILFAMHLCEYFIIGKKTGKENGVSVVMSAVNCLLFGFTWWLPLKNKGNEAKK